MSYPVTLGLLTAAAVLGNQSNYTIGHYFGPKVFQWEDSRFFNKRAFEQAHACSNRRPSSSESTKRDDPGSPWRPARPRN